MADRVQQRSRLAGTSMVALVALTLAGCGDQLSGPASESLSWGGVPVYRAPAGVPRPDVIIHHVADDSASAEFTVTASGGTFALGPHAIYFPPNAICDPATTSYGPTEWNAPCTPATEPIRFRAEVRSQDGRSWVDFTPAVRFVPASDPANGVWLYMKTASISADPDSVRAALRRMSILYSPAIGIDGVNEALTDPELRTYVWLEGGIAFRRIKHFSGYNIHDGFKCSTSTVESTVEDMLGLGDDDEDDSCGSENEPGSLEEVGGLIIPVLF